MTNCPEALYGAHGEANTQGKCPYCGQKIASRNWNQGSRRRTRSISREHERMIDSRLYERDAYGARVIPPWQDPEIDPEIDDYIYD